MSRFLTRLVPLCDVPWFGGEHSARLRVESAISGRFVAGDSVDTLARDYATTREQIEDVIRRWRRGRRTVRVETKGDRMTTWGHRRLADFAAGKSLDDIRRLLVRAARKDPYATPEDVPGTRRVGLWVDGVVRPSHSNRRLLALASGGRLVKGGGVTGGSVTIGSWSEVIEE
jgi:hypothetical protein